MSRRPALTISEERGVRHLHVGGEAIQSAMRLDDPFALELDYTRCMMAFLLFHPQPRRALMIGLGGGSLAKFFHRRLAGLRTHVVEYDERVIATARALFHVPADDALLHIEHGDGVDSLAPECCDLLVVDGYEDESTPAAMVSQAFFDAAWCALEEPGVFVMNVMDDDKELDRHLQRIEHAFGGAVVAFKALRDPNIVVIGLKGAPREIACARCAAPWRSNGPRLPFRA
jgi:spermidine synthase